MEMTITRPDGTVLDFEGTAEELLRLSQELLKPALTLTGQTTIQYVMVPCTRPHADEPVVYPWYTGPYIPTAQPPLPWNQTWPTNGIYFTSDASLHPGESGGIPS